MITFSPCDKNLSFALVKPRKIVLAGTLCEFAAVKCWRRVLTDSHRRMVPDDNVL